MSQTSRHAKKAAGEAKPPRPLWRRILLWGLAAGAALVGLGLLAFVVLYVRLDIPEPNDFATSETTIVYYSDGESELGRFSTENRVSVPLEDVPDHVQKAVLAAEDRTFYENQGISVPGIARALWNNVTGGDTQGGSTITQQYVKNYYLTQDQTLVRKVEEIILALKIDRTLSKDQILEDYLNTVYFGRGAYGVQTGAQAWFGVDVGDVDVSQGAVLASVLQSPSNYDPASGPEAASRLEARFDYVIDGMVEQGWLGEAEAAGAVVPEIPPPPSGNQLGGADGYLLAAVKAELLELGFSEQEIDSGGLRVQSTFDPQAQQAALAAVAAEVPTDTVDVHVGLVAVDPRSGAIRAMYGGDDYVERPLNDATQAYVPAGSTMKAFALAAALEDDVSLDSRFDGNSPFTIPGDTSAANTIRNAGGVSYGDAITLWQATASSVNTAFVDLTVTIGPDPVYDAAVRAGIPEELPNGQPSGLEPNARIPLGSVAVSTLQMTSSYATIAAEGVRTDPYTVEVVRDRNGGLAYEAEVETRPVYDALVTHDVTAALEGVVTQGTGREAQRLGRPVAVKTGTSGDTTVNPSLWFVGYTPDLVAGVTFYRAEGRPTDDLGGEGGLDNVSSGAYPGRTWTTFMEGALAGTPVSQFPPPANLGTTLRPVPTETATVAPTPTPTPAPPAADEPAGEGPPAEPPGGGGGDRDTDPAVVN